MFTAIDRVQERMNDESDVMHKLWRNPLSLSIRTICRVYADDQTIYVNSVEAVNDYLSELFAVYGKQQTSLALMELDNYLNNW